jgi:hypothetical protein
MSQNAKSINEMSQNEMSINEMSQNEMSQNEMSLVNDDLFDVENNVSRYVYSVDNLCCPLKCNKWCETLISNGDAIHFKIDTQGEVSVMSRSVYKSLKSKPVLQPSNVVIHGFGGNVTKSRGYVNLPVLKNAILRNVRVEVVDCKCPSILSDKDSEALGLVRRVFHTTEVPASTNKVMQKFNDVTKGIGCIPGEFSLKYDPLVKPVAHPPRPVPAALRDVVKRKLDKLESEGIICKVPVGVPTPWCSSLHTVLKRKAKQTDTADVRITIDPKDLNRALLREYHPISTIEDVITRTQGSRYFTTLDAHQGFFQIKLDEQSALLTAFNTPFGRYYYKRLPMGISSAPEIYQRAMTELFQGIDGVEIIMDDILVHGENLQIHNNRLEKVLQRCVDKGLKLNASKIRLAQSEVEYVGQILSKDGVKISPQKVQAVTEMPTPKTIHNVHTLLGMVNYVMKFLPELSSVTEPLRMLIKESSDRDFKFHWDPVHEESFATLKTMMSTAPY